MLRLAGGLVAVLIAGTAGLARYFLRGILRVTRTKDYDIPVLALGNDLASGSECASENRTVQLVATEDSLLPGTYGLS
ncbi:MAG: hypothetical protein M3492_02080, partial [Actinomycetota bacterium]|nr:hypothetical protein [Actinomycetota bacterium]